MTKLETSALDLLLQRLTWPSGLVRERACVSLGSLLADVELGSRITKAVLAWMDAQNLESVFVLGLLAFHQAKMRGGGIPPWDVISRVARPSLLSWLIAKDLYEEYVGDPDVANLHSGSAPGGFDANPFFREYAQSFVPPVYLSRAKSCDRKGCPGFLTQWAYEWTKLVEVTGFTLRRPQASFWTRQDDDHLVCVDFPLSEVYRSAFLRALAWAVDVRGMRPDMSLLLAAETCPIDLGLWLVSAGRAPEAWPHCNFGQGSVDTIPGSITSELGRMWQQQLGEDWLTVKASGRVHEEENSSYDVEIIGIVQACTGPDAPAIDSLGTHDRRRTIPWEAERLLTFGGSYKREPVENWQERHADWLVWPLAARADTNTIPRWQWWRVQRGVWLPSPILPSEAFKFRCTQEAVVVEEDGQEVARWIDWADGMRETNPANLMPPTGQTLLVRRSLIEREAAKLGGAFAWICKITTYNREYKYRAFAEAHFVLDFGTTRIVQGGA